MNIGAVSNARPRFSLRSLLEFMTICGLLCASSTALGIVASSWLLLVALGLWLKQGLIALCALIVSFIAIDWSAGSQHQSRSYVVAILVVLLAAALCGWYSFRRRE